MRASGACSSDTSPAASACSAAISSPVNSIWAAKLRPTALTSRCVPPLPGRLPIFASVSPKRAPVEAMRMSQASAISRPPPTATPLSAAITGLLKLSSGAVRRGRVTMVLAAMLECTATLPGVARSTPAQNAVPAPVRITTRTAISSSKPANAFASASRVASSMALRLSGRLKVRQATPASRVISRLLTTAPPRS